LDLSKERVMTLLENNDLKITETAVFKAVVEWGKSECKRKEKKSDSKDDLKYVLRACVACVGDLC
jgi:hypothetical protein